MSEWKPEETAPRNTKVLVGFCGSVAIASKSERTELWWDENGEIVDDVTHWMPLPEPPMEEKK